MPLDGTQRAAQEQFDRQSERYGRSHILADVSDVQRALAHVHLPDAARVLDVATGAGHTGLHLASLGYRVTCADLSSAMLDRVREAAHARALDVDVRQHPAEEMPYADESFDLVTCRIAPHHFSSPSDFVRESARVLRPHGWFLVIDGTVPDHDPDAETWLHQIEKLRDPSHARLLPPSEWQALCRQHQLTIVHAEVTPLKQPDLDWYFETANTTAGNRDLVRHLIATASPHVRDVYRLGEEDGKTVWWWPRLQLVACKAMVDAGPMLGKEHAP